MSDEQFYKTIVLRGAWEKAGLRESLPPPDVIDSQVCYMRDIAFARKVLALLKEHAGDLEVDRSIGTIERSLALRGEKNHDRESTGNTTGQSATRNDSRGGESTRLLDEQHEVACEYGAADDVETRTTVDGVRSGGGQGV